MTANQFLVLNSSKTPFCFLLSGSNRKSLYEQLTVNVYDLLDFEFEEGGREGGRKEGQYLILNF